MYIAAFTVLALCFISCYDRQGRVPVMVLFGAAFTSEDPNSAAKHLFSQDFFYGKFWRFCVICKLIYSLSSSLRHAFVGQTVLHMLTNVWLPVIVTAHTFRSCRDTRVSYGWCLLRQEYFCAV